MASTVLHRLAIAAPFPDRARHDRRRRRLRRPRHRSQKPLRQLQAGREAQRRDVAQAAADRRKVCCRRQARSKSPKAG